MSSYTSGTRQVVHAMLPVCRRPLGRHVTRGLVSFKRCFTRRGPRPNWGVPSFLCDNACPHCSFALVKKCPKNGRNCHPLALYDCWRSKLSRRVRYFFGREPSTKLYLIHEFQDSASHPDSSILSVGGHAGTSLRAHSQNGGWVNPLPRLPLTVQALYITSCFFCLFRWKTRKSESFANPPHRGLVAPSHIHIIFWTRCA